MTQHGATEPNQGAKETSRSISIRYEKSKFCRVIHADGVWGGITPQGFVHMSVYSEHSGLPKDIVVNPGENLRRPLSPQGIVREIEVEVIMTLPLVKALRVWLDDKIERFEKPKKTVGEETSESGGRP